MLGLMNEVNECSLCRPIGGVKRPGAWRRFSLGELCAATNNFNYDNKLGEGVIGSVYWGQLASGDQVYQFLTSCLQELSLRLALPSNQPMILLTTFVYFMSH